MKTLTSAYFDFIKQLVLFTIVLTIICYGVRHFIPPNWRTPALPFLLFFFFLVNAFVHFIMLKATAKRFSRFVNYYLAGSFMKLLLYIIILVIYIYNYKSDALAFTVSFFFLYLFFTTFEIISLLGAKARSNGNT